MKNPPGTEQLRRFRPRLRYELFGCALHGHELLGTDASRLRASDNLFARESGGLRWYRCLRCDSWLPLPKPAQPTAPFPPKRTAVAVPLRGKPLRDRYVLRLIALDRAFHVVVFSALAVVVFLFKGHERQLQHTYAQVLTAIQGGVQGPTVTHPYLNWLGHIFTITPAHLKTTALILLTYALLEAVEAVGLWQAKRWAEYLTFVATISLLPLEIYELTHKFTILKVLTLVINLAIAGYLLYAKRLFGSRGGGIFEAAERQRDTGWAAIERATPGTEATPLS
ncbi:MAG: DUF2127 domain-containing protein [Candidatus Saccharibacteria bacterium]